MRTSRCARIVAFAYACEPGRGSEPGAGWGWSLMLGRLADATILTREIYRPSIERALEAVPESDRPRFVYVDVPMLAERCGDSRWLRAYYPIWQFAALRAARNLHRGQPFDISWHLTWANAWLGSLAPSIGPRSIFGPVGGGADPPIRSFSVLGPKGAACEIARWLAKTAFRYLNPLARLAWRRSDLLLTQNRDTVRWFPGSYRDRAAVFPHIVLDEPNQPSPDHLRRPRTAVFAGRLLPWKGVSLALRAISLSPGWHLTICGDGPDRARLQRLAGKLGLSDRVTFAGWLPRQQLRSVLGSSEVFLFPSLHDEGGWVVTEALQAGAAVICLDIGGPPELVSGSGVVVAASGSMEDIAQRLASALDRARPGTQTNGADRFLIDNRTEELHLLLEARFPELFATRTPQMIPEEAAGGRAQL